MKNLAIIIIAGVLSGCAYMANGDTQSIDFKTSDNKKVKAEIKNDDITSKHTLPSKITVKKSSNDLIVTTIGTECITPTKTVLQSSLDGWVWANIANLGLGLLIDLQGPAWKYDDSYTIKVNRDYECINRAKKINEEMLNLHLAM